MQKPTHSVTTCRSKNQHIVLLHVEEKPTHSVTTCRSKNQHIVLLHVEAKTNT